jgi:hypothetical protein
LISCGNSVSYKTGKLESDNQKEIMMLINIDKGDTLIYHVNDSIFNFQDSTRQKAKDTLPKEITSFDEEKMRLNHFFKEKGGIVKDARTAADIAYVYLKNIYGEKQINDELPLNVYSIDNYWFIEGSFNTGILEYFSPKFGGVAEIIIRKTDGQVIHVSHGK